MCGIAGIVNWGRTLGRHELHDIVRGMCDTMVHRGPDDADVWVDDEGLCALGHRRLSIIDLSAEGRQPMANEDGGLHITFNGEIYNHLALRERLEREGHAFRGHSDGEVLSHLFEPMRPEALDELDGMYAFAAWRSADRRLLLARDPFGKKPLYYAEGPGWLAFASELRCLARVPGVDRAIDRDALALYHLLQYVPAPWSILRGVRKLPPGCHLEARAEAPAPKVNRHFTWTARAPRGRPAIDAQLETLHDLVVAAVDKRLMSDVPLGAFLSGGVDSSLVVAVMARELGRRVQTFSIGFGGTDETEHGFAREVADHLGTEHHEEVLEFDAVQLVGEIAGRLDEPNGDSSCLPTYLLSRFARRFVTVALSGDGGDELFGGYGRYRDTLLDAAWWTRARRSLRHRRWWRPSDGYVSPRLLIFMPDAVDDLFGGTPPAVAEFLASMRRQVDEPGTPVLHRMRTLDASTYLPGAVLAKVDRMSMQVSLEVRCPLLDRDVAAFARDLQVDACWRPPADTKRLLKRLAARYLPEAWMNRRKMGFGLPSNAWSQDALLDLASDLIEGPDCRLATHLDGDALRRQIVHQRQPGCFSIYQLWPLLVLESWLRDFDAPAPAAARPAGALAAAGREA